MNPPISRRERNRRFAKESRDRKNRYIKKLEERVEQMEKKIMNLNLELEQYKNLLKISDISKDKDTELQTVLKDFKNTSAFFKEKIQEANKTEKLCMGTWEKILQNVGTNIGPKGSVRKKVSLST
jgi:type II secretory pathway component HofQ